MGNLCSMPPLGTRVGIVVPRQAIGLGGMALQVGYLPAADE